MGTFSNLRAESGGLLDLSSLMTTSQNVRFNVSSSGQLKMGSMLGSDLNINVTDVGSSVEVTGSWNLGPNSSLAVSNGGEVWVAGNFGHQQINESAINLNAATLRMNGIGGQLFEAASEDLGLGGPMAGNFGIGQLVIGQTVQRTSVDLIDVVDNGNRGTTGTEALYLFGLGGPDGLRILNDSALVLNGINVYAWDATMARMVHINGLFGPTDLRIPFDDGFVQLTPLDFQWIDPAGGGFNEADNWSDNLVPLASDSALFNLASLPGYTVQFPTNVSTDSAIVKNDRVTFELGGFTYNLARLHATDSVVVGLGPLDTGHLTVTNGTLSGVSGRIAADAAASGTMVVTSTGRLTFTEDLTLGVGTATLDVDSGGVVRVGTTLAGNATSTISLQGGTVTVGTGSVEQTASTLRVHTDGILASAGTVVGSVVNDGQVDVGQSVGILEISSDFTQSATGVTNLEIAGAVPGSGHDQLVVGEDVFLDGSLVLNTDGLTADFGDTFVLIDAIGSVNEHFATVDGLELSPTSSLAVVYDPSQVVAVVALPADANLDGSVDGQDFIAWNANKFQSGTTWSQADFNGDGTTDGVDFIIWNEHKFTSTDAIVVPEPPAMFLTLLAMLGLAARRRTSPPG